MPMSIYAPVSPLARYIECLWQVDDQVTYTREKILPSGRIELMFNFGSPHRLYDGANDSRFRLMRHSWIAGFQTTYIVNEPVAETQMLGVRFRPGGAYPFFDFSVSELSNFVIDGDLVWGAQAADLREQLALAPTPAARFRLMERVLLARLRSDLFGVDQVQYATRTLARPDCALSIGELSDHLGISQKHLNHQFKKIVGVSPKAFARVMKLQHVLHTINPQQPINWADIAYQCQYYDQAHFNHDFAAFTGLNPTAYVTLRRQYLGELQAGEGVHFVPIG